MFRGFAGKIDLKQQAHGPPRFARGGVEPQGEIDLDQHLDAASRFSRGLIDPLQQVDAVDRVNRADGARGLPRLVRLQVPDEMPGGFEVVAAFDLGQRFLDLVLAEVALPGSSRRPDGFDRKCFRDGDEADAGGVAPDPAGGVRDTFANAASRVRRSRRCSRGS